VGSDEEGAVDDLMDSVLRYYSKRIGGGVVTDFISYGCAADRGFPTQ
jgi:hypothetical protein